VKAATRSLNFKDTLMEKLIRSAQTLVEALPYIQEFAGKTVVIKYGGAAMVEPHMREATATDIVLMKYVGMNPVVVHGGGPVVSDMMQRLGIAPEFRDGLRVTDSESMRVVEMVLVGQVNKELVALINRAGGRTIGLCGKDGMLLEAEQHLGRDSDGAPTVDIGRVGRITRVNPRVLEVLDGAGFIPVIAPVATDDDGGSWNVNADTVAGEVAAALQAEKLVFLTDSTGILDDETDPDSRRRRVTLDEIDELIAQGVITGGMLPKVEACAIAVRAGVHKTHIIDGRVTHALLLEILTDKGIGTVVGC